MFGIDFSEIVLIFALALVVLGPKRLPQVAATVGRWVGRARAMARQFREQLEQEANALHTDLDPHLEDVTGAKKTEKKPEPVTPAADSHERGP
ncbi:MAG: Sec-independent protein translocase protein TatB [Steroidobacterales bacterium]